MSRNWRKECPRFSEIAVPFLRNTHIWAENSPFDLKDVLKARGYCWNPDGTPFPKAWFIDVFEDGLEAEVSFLQKEIYQREIQLLTRKIDAFNRFSDRL